MSDAWSLYVHVPWCRRRCTYCDFYFEVGKPQPHFGAEILGEYRERRPFWPSKPASTLYFGGGTPSLLQPLELEFFLNGLREDPSVLELDAEITLEANPEDLNAGVVADFKALGFNRISLGVQSLDDSVLKRLGRKHSSAMAHSAVELCASQFERVSVDLIFGIPGEDPYFVSQSINRLKELGVGHISAYLLTIEQGTSLAKQIEKGRFDQPCDDRQADAYEQVQAVMAQNGYRQYEVSSYAIPGQESRHNRNYWGKGAYLGLGPAAHSMRHLNDGSVERSKNKASLTDWRSDLSSLVERESEVLAGPDAFLEAVSFGLRDLVRGVKLGSLARKHHCEVPAGLLQILEKSVRKDWLIQDEENTGHYYLTQTGVRFSDAVAREILSLSEPMA